MDIIGMNKFHVGLRFSVTVLSGSTAAVSPLDVCVTAWSDSDR
jgi:hypothetical protein